mgnify:CR=1 FL=1
MVVTSHIGICVPSDSVIESLTCVNLAEFSINQTSMNPVFNSISWSSGGSLQKPVTQKKNKWYVLYTYYHITITII